MVAETDETLAPIAIFDAEPPGINCVSIVLNCAEIIQLRWTPLQRRWFSELSPLLIANFQLSFSIVLASFPRFGHLLLIYRHEVNN